MKIFWQTVLGVAIFIILAVGILIGIRNINRRPSVILTSTECMPPCWHGIRPGETSSWGTYEILNKFEGINEDTLMWQADQNGVLTSIEWFFQRPVEDQGGYIYFKDNKVTAIEIMAVNSLKLSDLFDKLGPPEEYWTTIGKGENRQYLEVALIHRTKGYVADVLIDFEGNVNQVEIRKNTPVFTVVYFAPEIFDELLKTRILINHPVDPKTFRRWIGFGAISFERKE